MDKKAAGGTFVLCILIGVIFDKVALGILFGLLFGIVAGKAVSSRDGDGA